MLFPGNLKQIAPLILKYLRNELTVEDEIQLNHWLAESEKNRVFLENISEEKIIQVVEDFDEEKIWEKIQLGIASPVIAEPEPVYHKPVSRKWVAAAAAVVVLGTAGWLIWNKSHEPSAKQTVASVYKNDVAPGKNTATLTLSNGSTVILDTAAQGKITQEGNTKVVKTESGQLAYALDQSMISRARQELLNTVSTPRGGQYELLLSDGSRVWLNAASSLKYPVYFTGKERLVELTGEAYFEVAKNPKLPFKVKVNGMEVEVLGTHFNVMAYSDEREIATTLLEGSVKITEGKESALLRPGQQSLANPNGTIRIVENANVEEVIAWQKGIFQFNNADIQTIMRQAARWYDVEITFDGNIPEHFNATIPRNVSVSKLFSLLDLTGHVHFNVDGKKVIVTP